MRMGTHKAAIVFFLILACPILSSSQTCSDSSCSQNEPTIRFPFRLRRIQPRQCGYPGFDLSCDSQSQTVVELPNSGQFSVRSINYFSQEIWLNDPANCLPLKLLTLNLSGSPLRGALNQEFSLFSCNTTFDYSRLRFNPVACLNNDSNNTIIATSSTRAARFLSSNGCSSMRTVTVPVEWPFIQPVWSSDLSEDIRLTWDTPQCQSCESRGGRCGLDSSNDIVCSSTRRGIPRGARIAMGFGAGVPAALFIIGLVCFCCKRKGSHRRRPQHTVEFTATVAPQPMIIITGLDGPTIESYPKTVLGESRRLPKPDDNICPICLCEYKPKETLRTIPACHHCFHADCIDEWLRLNATCPVCRNSPRQTPPVEDS